jgi:hypothetical protein
MWPTVTQKEYQITGMCRSCQADFFEEDRDRCTCNSPCCEADVGVGIITCGGQHCWVHEAATKSRSSSSVPPYRRTTVSSDEAEIPDAVWTRYPDRDDDEGTDTQHG